MKDIVLGDDGLPATETKMLGVSPIDIANVSRALTMFYECR